MLARPIPATGEPLPVIGCGTWQAFDVAAGDPALQPLAAVLGTLWEGGGSVIDSSPMLWACRACCGDLLAADDSRDRRFLATKVWTKGREAGIQQMLASLELLQTDHIDLMQVHNLLDWRVHMLTLRDWKAAGRIRYIGITHYTEAAHGELEMVMRSAAPDFVQLNYSLTDRAAEQRLLPLAAELGIAVLANRPLGEGSLLRHIGQRPLPVWAAEVACASWSQLLLKYVISHPAVTCAIPGTGNPAHMAENCSAGEDVLLDADQRRWLAGWWDSL